MAYYRSVSGVFYTLNALIVIPNTFILNSKIQEIIIRVDEAKRSRFLMFNSVFLLTFNLSYVV
jgi:hypothetical protein